MGKYTRWYIMQRDKKQKEKELQRLNNSYKRSAEKKNETMKKEA